MVHHIEIKDTNPDAKNLLMYLRNLAKKNKYIDFLTEQQIEDLEDKILLKKMKQARESGILNESEKKSFLAQIKKDLSKYKWSLKKTL